MMQKLLMAISGRLPCRIISDGDKPYLERYYLCTILGVRVYLHRFVASDPDRGLHDHPWRWAFSVILLGWYYEQTRYGIRKVRWFNKLTGDTFHRVILFGAGSGDQLDYETPTQVWTLFMHQAERAKPWGFLRDKGQLGTIYIQHKYKTNELGKDEDWWNQANPGRYTQWRQP
jgi:hypothetical protein